MSDLDSLHQIARETISGSRIYTCRLISLFIRVYHQPTLQEESIMSITCRMLLWLEESIEVPETGFSKAVGCHFLEAHFKEDFTELLTNFHERMQMTTSRRNTNSIKVVLFESSGLPFTTINNIRSPHPYSILVPLVYLCNISYVISVASFLTSSANSGPLVTLYEVVFLS